MRILHLKVPPMVMQSNLAWNENTTGMLSSVCSRQQRTMWALWYSGMCLHGTRVASHWLTERETQRTAVVLFTPEDKNSVHRRHTCCLSVPVLRCFIRCIQTGFKLWTNFVFNKSNYCGNPQASCYFYSASILLIFSQLWSLGSVFWHSVGYQVGSSRVHGSRWPSADPNKEPRWVALQTTCSCCKLLMLSCGFV